CRFTGGQIRNAAVHAAPLALGDARLVGDKGLVDAAGREKTRARQASPPGHGSGAGGAWGRCGGPSWPGAGPRRAPAHASPARRAPGEGGPWVGRRLLVGVVLHTAARALEGTLAALAEALRDGDRVVLVPDGPDAALAASLRSDPRLAALPQLASPRPRGNAA